MVLFHLYQLAFSSLSNDSFDTMLNIDVALTPEEIKASDIKDKSVLIVDILRATSTITIAMANGASFIIPVNTPNEAFELSAKHDRNFILGGEVDGKRIEGFHLGNSLSEYLPSIVRNKAIIFRTTNGTRAINLSQYADHLTMGSFLNLTSVCHYLVEIGRDILIVCSGKEGKLGVEDVCFAGACISKLNYQTKITKTDSAVVSEIVYNEFRDDILLMLKASEHGRYLIEIGLENDLSLCAQVDITNAIPIYHYGKIILKD